MVKDDLTPISQPSPGTTGPLSVWSLILQEANQGLFTGWWGIQREVELQYLSIFHAPASVMFVSLLTKSSHIRPNLDSRWGEIDPTSWSKGWHGPFARRHAYTDGKHLWPFAICLSHKISKWPSCFWNLVSHIAKPFYITKHGIMIFFGIWMLW